MKSCTSKADREGFKEDDDSSDLSEDMGDSSQDEIDSDDSDSEGSAKDDEAKGGEEEDDDDDIVKAFKRAREVKRTKPPDIECEDPVADLSFHPEQNLLAAATLEGDIVLYSFSNEACKLEQTIEVHTMACRCVEFNPEGDSIYSVSKDKSVVISDAATGKMKRFTEGAHDDPLYVIKIIDDNRFATGDEEGTVKVWDARQKEAIFSLKNMEDSVNDMIVNETNRRFLICASAEGTITAVDLINQKMHVQSELYESELNCLALVKQDRKLVVGSGKGIYYYFDWGSFGYHSDEFPGPKFATNCMQAVTQNIVVTGSEDGILRATHMFPHKQLGIVGQHSSSVESLDISGDGELLATCGFDQTIKFWNIKYFDGLKISEREKSDKKVLQHNLPSSNAANAADFFKDMA